MSEARVKDCILEQLKAFKSHNEIEGLSKYISNLERDGYVSAVLDEEGDLIVVRITSRGKTDSEMVSLTHHRGTPWDMCYVERKNEVVPDEITEWYYKRIVDDFIDRHKKA